MLKPPSEHLVHPIKIALRHYLTEGDNVTIPVDVDDDDVDVVPIDIDSLSSMQTPATTSPLPPPIVNLDFTTALNSVDQKQTEQVLCDAVVLAARAELANISLPHDIAGIVDVGRSFRQTFATFVKDQVRANTICSKRTRIIVNSTVRISHR